MNNSSIVATKIKIAKELDIQKQYVAAASIYENVLNEDETPVEVYIDLACLYFDAADFGIYSYYGLPPSFYNTSWERMTNVLEEAQARFGHVAEVEFWKRYIAQIYLGGDSFVELAHELVQQDNSLVPYFYLHNKKDDTYLPQIKALIKQCKLELTSKNRYILSIIGRCE